MEVVGCNLCGSIVSTPVCQISDLLLEREEVQTTLVQCNVCGLVYQNPRPTQSEMEAHYPPEYESYQSSTPGKKIPWLLQKAYDYGINKRCRIVTRAQKQGGRLLDVGCATGTFLLGMRRQENWELFGVEPSEHAAKIACAHGLNVFVGLLEEANFPDNTFDAVTLWDVLEHMHDPKSSLSEIYRILKPGGTLVVRVPNLDSWDARLFKNAWAGLDAPRHLFVFGHQTLRKLFEDSGFEIRTMRSEIGSYPTFILSVRFGLVQAGAGVSIRRVVVNVLSHPFFRLILAPLFYLYSLDARGPLVTISAQKGNGHD